MGLARGGTRANWAGGCGWWETRAARSESSGASDDLGDGVALRVCVMRNA